MIIFTSICANYLHKARTLAESVKNHVKDVRFYVGLTEREIKPHYYSSLFDGIVLSKDIWDDNFNQFIFKHTIVEASTSVKGRLFKYFIDSLPDEDMFVYLDPDCYVYSDFTELRDLLKTRPIIVCPHLLQPGNIDMELSSTIHGVYNLGFLAVNRSKEAVRFIDWWSDRLKLYCYDDIENGVFTDQKWIDLAPCFFDVEILKHKGYDFATWSLYDCGMTIDKGQCFIKSDPLRFIHYSGYGNLINKCMSKWLPEVDHPFKQLYNEYCKIHERNNYDNVSETEWSYARFYNGTIISPRIRRLYRNANKTILDEDPFSLNDKQLLCELEIIGIKNIAIRLASYYLPDQIKKKVKKCIRRR